MTNSTPSTGSATWQEPCYHYPGVEAPRPTHSMYDNLTMNFPAMPSCHSRYPTPRPSRAASVQNLGGHLAPKGDHDSKKKVISFSDIVVGICYLLLEYLYLVPQYIKLVFWFVIWAVFCLLIAARSYAKKANGGTSHGGGRELAVHRSAAPLAGASGGGWSELYEKLDIRAEKLRAAKFKDETDISEDDERRRKEAAMSKYLNLIS